MARSKELVLAGRGKLSRGCLPRPSLRQDIGGASARRPQPGPHCNAKLPASRRLARCLLPRKPFETWYEKLVDPRSLLIPSSPVRSVQLVHPAGGNDTHSEHLSTMSTGSINSAGTGESFIHTRPRTASEKEQRTRVESLNSRIDDDLCGCESSLLAGQEEGEADSVLGDTSKERAEPERGHGGATRAPAGSPTMQAVRSSSSMLFERRSLLGAPHVRLLLFTYGLYMVGRPGRGCREWTASPCTEWSLTLT